MAINIRSKVIWLRQVLARVIPTARRERLLTLLLLILTILSLALGWSLYNLMKNQAPVKAVTLTLSPPVLNQLVKAKPVTGSPLPTRLKIPTIGVDASLDYVGLVADGALGVPKGPSTAAWFDLGPRPGDTGSAVIDGHFGTWLNGQHSVFDNLYKLHKGDTLTVEDNNRVAITFVVTELRIYNQKDDATDIFKSSDGQAHLNLITCEGVWNIATQSFPSRLVVFTNLQQ